MEENDKITFETWNKVASLYQEKFMDLDIYNDSYDCFCELIPTSQTKILEIGCGPGNITRYLLQKRPDFVLYAIDIAPNMVTLAKVNNPSIQAFVKDIRAIREIEYTFDGIIGGFCLPYLNQEAVQQLIVDSNALLNPQGVLYLSGIEGLYTQSGFETSSSGDKAYVYYYPEKLVVEWLTQQGFKIIEVFRKNYPKKDQIQTHWIIIAQKIDF